MQESEDSNENVKEDEDTKEELSATLVDHPDLKPSLKTARFRGWL